jgi:hypothetical protein
LSYYIFLIRYNSSTGDLPWFCDVCKKRFRSGSAWDHHLDRHHPHDKETIKARWVGLLPKSPPGVETQTRSSSAPADLTAEFAPACQGPIASPPIASTRFTASPEFSMDVDLELASPRLFSPAVVDLPATQSKLESGIGLEHQYFYQHSKFWSPSSIAKDSFGGECVLGKHFTMANGAIAGDAQSWSQSKLDTVTSVSAISDSARIPSFGEAFGDVLVADESQTISGWLPPFRAHDCMWHPHTSPRSGEFGRTGLSLPSPVEVYRTSGLSRWPHASPYNVA